MYKNLTNRITALLIGAILITIVAVSSVIVWMSAEHNRISAEDSIVRIDGGLRSLETSLKLLAIDYSWWQEAYDNINARNDEWVYSNMGISVVDSATAEVATVDLVYILSPAGAPIYGWVKDGGNASATDVLEPGVIADLREQLAQQPSDAPAAVIQFASVNDHLFLLSATRVMPTVFDEIDPATLPTSVMGYRLDTARISDLGKSFLTDDLMLSETIPPKFQSIALRSAKGETLGHLVWQASRPGRELLQKSALPIIIALGLFTLFGAIISRNARKIATALVDQNERTRRLLVMAEAANDAKTEFLGNITHELRTPMIGVIGTADILSTRDLSRQDKDLVEIVKFSGTSLLSLITTSWNIRKLRRVKSNCAINHSACGSISKELWGCSNWRRKTMIFGCI